MMECLPRSLPFGSDNTKSEPRTTDLIVVEETCRLDDDVLEEYANGNGIVGIICFFKSPPLARDAPHSTSISMFYFTHSHPSSMMMSSRPPSFTLHSKIGEKMCKMIVEDGNGINATLNTFVSHSRLHFLDHPCPYHVSYIDITSIPIRHKYHIFIEVQ